MTLRRPLALLTLVALTAGSAAAARREPPNLAFIPLWSAGVREATVTALERDLGREIRALPGVRLQPRKQTQNHLRAARSMGLACNHQADDECFARVGVLAGAERVVAGFVGPADDGGLLLELRLIDVRSGSELRKGRKVLRRGDDRQRELRELVTRLLDPSRHMGMLALDVEPRGARVLVDAVSRGTAPLDGPVPLSAEFHRVRVELEGYAPFEQVVEIPFEETLELQVRLEKVAAAEPPAAGPSRFRVLVLDPAPNDPGVPNPRTIGSLIAVELNKLEHFDVVTSADLKQLAQLEVERQSLGCTDTSCLSELAGAMGASLVVFGDVGKLGDLLIVNLSLFDSEKARSLGRVSVQTSSLEELPAKVSTALRGLARGFLESKGIVVEGSAKGDGSSGDGSKTIPADPPGGEVPPSFDVMAVVPWGVTTVGALGTVGGVLVSLTCLEPRNRFLDAYEGFDKAAPVETQRALIEQMKESAGDYHLRLWSGVGIAAASGLVAIGGVTWALWPAEPAAE